MKLGYSGSLILILEPMTVFYRVHQRNSIHNIASFLNSAHRLIAKERTGQYPGGRAQAFKRSAALGVFVAYWAMKGLAAGLWKQVLELAVNGFPMVVAGAFQRFVIRIKGRSHAETIGTAGLHFQAQQPSLSAKRSNS
jgi:hypothetical protein